MKIFHFILIIILSISNICFAQSPFCGFDGFREKMISENPQILEQERLMNEKVYKAIINNEIHKNSGGTIIIPIVFHIMHNNGSENLPDSVIVNAVEELNLRFQNAAPYYDSTGNAIDIQFCLASVDPGGNPTTGITRTVTTLTNIVYGNDDANLKSLNRWSSFLYFNVWVVNSIIGNVAGYATLPNWVGSGIDGVVMEAQYVANSHVLIHEAGHYLGLIHTFFYSCHNQNCLLNGDLVCDTPPDTSQFGMPCMWNSCSTDTQDTTGLSPFTADVNELPNYMDYTNCPISFTAGQGERMEIMFNMYRSLLLNSNGCGANPGQVIPVAGYNFTVLPCNNGEVSFSDSISVDALTTEWDLNNDGIYEIMGNNFTHIFPATGNYLVTQRVTGLGGQDSISHIVSVRKGTTPNYPIITPGSAMDTLRVCAGDTLIFEGDAGALSYLWSTGETTSSITIIAANPLVLNLTMTDANGFTWTTACTPVTIEVYPNNVPVITYDDTVGYSCQGDLLSVYIVNPDSGVYTWQVYNVAGGWFNTLDHNLVYNYYADPYNGSQFYVTYTNPAGCDQVSNIVSVQPHLLPFLNGVPLNVFNYTLAYSVNGFQYQWYNHNTPIPGATNNYYIVTSTGCYKMKAWDSAYPDCETFTDTVCFEFTGLNELESNLKIVPNPANDFITVSGLNTINDNLEYKVWNMPGQQIIASGIITGQNTLTLDCSNWNEGVYIFEIATGSGSLRRKIVVTGY